MIPKILLGLAALAITYAAVEGFVRWGLYKKYCDAHYVCVVHDDYLAVDNAPIYRRPNAVINAKLFMADNSLAYAWTFRTNNFGLVSRRDYEPAKQTAEFRIALIGDSLTACINNDLPWGDVLEDRLNADEGLKKVLGVCRFTVFNFGREGSGWRRFAKDFVEFAEPFKPDLVLVNYILQDFPRTDTGVNLQDLPERSSFLPETVAHLQPSELKPSWGLVDIRGEKVQLPLLNFKPDQIKMHRDPLSCAEAYVGPYLLVRDPAAISTPEKLKAIKSEIAGRYLSSRIWLSSRPLAILLAMKRPISFNVEDSYLSQMNGMQSTSDEWKVENAAQAMDIIAKKSGLDTFLAKSIARVHDESKSIRLKWGTMIRQRRPDYAVVDMQNTCRPWIQKRVLPGTICRTTGTGATRAPRSTRTPCTACSRNASPIRRELVRSDRK